MPVVVYVQPRLLVPPSSISVNKNQTASFECYFISSSNKYLTIFQWKKDSLPIIYASDSTKYRNVIGRGAGVNILYSILIISHATDTDSGKYRCSCYYNTTILNEIHVFKPFVSEEGYAVLSLRGTMYKLSSNL